MGIRRTFLLILLPLAILIVILLAFVLDMKLGLLAFAVSFIISTLLILIFFRVVEVNGYERLIVSRGGGFVDTGIHGGRAFLVRGFERPIPVDLRQRREDVTGDRCFTKEGIGVDIDYFFLWRVVDPMRFLLGPQDVPGTLNGMASAILKNEVGKMSLVEVLMQRDNISRKLKADLEAFDKANAWGIQFITIELGSTKIPPEIEKAMARIMAADKQKEAILIEMQARAEAFDKLRDKVGGDALLIQMLKDLVEAFGRKT
ncbi:MAG: SPFH domain-containing protein [Chloroflexi bacterium]|nr:SPFH domain-containing protein [Chloroflexota bacterium]